jgi:hypothetical protein
VRAPDGTIATFSASGDPEDNTEVSDINANGQIVGYFSTPDEVHGYLRDPDGAVTSFDVPGATETEPARINNKKMIAGTYSDAAGSAHGFLRSSRGKIVSFDVPDARFLLVTGLTDAGLTSGFTINSEIQSFVRSPDGTVTVFTVDGKETETECANRAGTLAGAYGNPDGHGYLRTMSGEILVFGIPRTKTGIYSACINDDGVAAGDYHPQKSGLRYGYIRYP